VVSNPFRSRRETRRRVREAVDAEKAKGVLSEAAEADVEPDAEAAEALRVAAAEETADVAESAVHRARPRGRKNTPPRTRQGRTNDLKTATTVDDADNDRWRIRPFQVLP
jgi:hypothetical protein